MSSKAAKTTPVKKAPVKRKAAKGYKLPDPIRNGEILKDVMKKEWQIGPSIGVGGFGEIYSATDISDTPKKKASYPYVVKIEPHGNGPLFVEMHFYMKVAKPIDIETWVQTNNLKMLGMPRYLGSGSHEYNGEKYRFVVMDRYGKDLWSLFLDNNRIFPYPTVLRIGLQVLDVLEYIHSKGYVHADIKGGNLLLGLKKGSENQVYLVDFGLASRYSEKEYKPDPKKAHNGTIEYTSRDAHNGVPTRRGDLEILGYNMLQWLASKLPWENKLTDPVYVQQQKNEYMDNISGLLKKCFTKGSPPAAIMKYFEYIASLKHSDVPDYVKCRKLLETGFKDCKCPMEGKLEFKSKGTEVKSSKSSARKPKKETLQSGGGSDDDDDDEEEEEEEPTKKKKVGTPVVNGIRKTNRGRPKKAVATNSSADSGEETNPDVNGKSESNGKLIDKSRFVYRAGEYKRLPPDQRPYDRKKQKKDEA